MEVEPTTTITSIVEECICKYGLDLPSSSYRVVYQNKPIYLVSCRGNYSTHETIESAKITDGALILISQFPGPAG